MAATVSAVALGPKIAVIGIVHACIQATVGNMLFESLIWSKYDALPRAQPQFRPSSVCAETCTIRAEAAAVLAHKFESCYKRITLCHSKASSPGRSIPMVIWIYSWCRPRSFGRMFRSLRLSEGWQALPVG